MDSLFVVALISFIVILVLIMFFFLKNIISRINQQSKSYFVDKLQVYDNLINEKEEKLNGLNEKIKKKETQIFSIDNNDMSENNSVFLYDLKNIDYQDDKIFSKMKDIDERFKFDSSKVIKKFIKDYFNESDVSYYKSLIDIKKKLNKDKIYYLVSKSRSVQEEYLRYIFKGDMVKILDDFLKKNKKLDILKFTTYFNEIISMHDPYIYVYVGNKEENYDNIHEFIKTKVDSSIYKGIIIVYKKKMYDFSLK